MAEKLKGKLKCGFAYEIDKTGLDNYELLEAMAEIEEKPLVAPKVIRLVLGEDQKNALVSFLKEKNGIATTTAMGEAIAEIMEQQAQLKNS